LSFRIRDATIDDVPALVRPTDSMKPSAPSGYTATLANSTEATGGAICACLLGYAIAPDEKARAAMILRKDRARC
jgi:hypothetical protein